MAHSVYTIHKTPLIIDGMTDAESVMLYDGISSIFDDHRDVHSVSETIDKVVINVYDPEPMVAFRAILRDMETFLGMTNHRLTVSWAPFAYVGFTPYTHTYIGNSSDFE